MKKLFIRFMCLIGLAIATCASRAIYAYFVQEPWPSDLVSDEFKPSIPSYNEVPLTKDNGYYYLINLPKLTGSISEQAYKALKQCNSNSEVETYIKANQKALSVFQQALDCPESRPRYSKKYEKILKLNFSKMRKLVWLELYDAMQQHHYAQSLIKLQSLSNVLRKGYLHDSMISSSIQKQINDNLKLILSTKALSKSQIAELAENLSKFSSIEEPFSESVKAELYGMQCLVNDFYKKNYAILISWGIISKGQAIKQLRKINANINIAIKMHLDMISPTCPSKNTIDFFYKNYKEESYGRRCYTIPYTLLFSIQLLFGEDPSMHGLFPKFEYYNQKQLEIDTNQRGMILYTAVHGYFAEHGKLPESVNDLIPTYFDSVPKNPYANDKENILYRRLSDTEWKIYTEPAIIPLDPDKEAFALSLKGEI